ncbi:MAG: hypothetical protein GY953_09785, partial [bacterium]|nr:hypothetical protein [bacterium]
MTRTLLAVLLLGLAMPGWVPAQEPEDDGPGVARLSVMNGEVTIRRGDSGDWVAAALNAPIVTSDAVFVGRSSRAEVQLDSSNMVRMADETELRFAELEYQRFQVQVAKGTIMLSVLRDNDSEVDINTPNISIRPLERGRYRVSVREDGTTEVTVRTGQVEVFSPTGVEVLRAGRTMVVRGTASEPEFQIASAIPKDAWDQWNEQRDKDLRRGYGGYKYASRDISGVEDLDGYGSWVYVPPYGWVWSPRVASTWAPYRHGRWSWIDYYGWNWVSYDPWGWAPYHYGRWFHRAGYGWHWWPGVHHHRHYYRPALVAFFGWGHHSGFHVGVGFGFGHVGWVPLAPYERYHRWYGHRYYNGYRNNTYVDNSVNVVNNINVTNIYRNARVNNAITAVEGNNFGNRRVRNVFNGSQHNVRQANLVRGQVPVVPQRASLNYTDRQVRRANVPSRSDRQSFAGRRTATRSPTQRATFAQQQRGVERATRAVSERQNQRSATAGSRPTRSTASRAGQSGARVTNAQRSAAPSRGATRSTTSSGWRRFGEPARTSGSTATRSARPSTSGSRQATSNPSRSATRGATPRSSSSQTPSGWRRFGEPTRRSAGSTASRSSQRTPRSSSGSQATRSGSSGSSSRGSSTFGSRGTTSRPSSGASRSNSGSSRSLGVRPPVVRERSASGSSRSTSRAPSNRTYSPPSRSGSSSNRTYSPPSRSSRTPSNRSASPSRSSRTPSNRTYSPPSRSSRTPSGRTYSAPSRSSRAPSGRTYSAPSRSSRAPSGRTYSAPSRSSRAPSGRTYSAP